MGLRLGDWGLGWSEGWGEGYLWFEFGVGSWVWESWESKSHSKPEILVCLDIFGAVHVCGSSMDVSNFCKIEVTLGSSRG